MIDVQLTLSFPSSSVNELTWHVISGNNKHQMGANCGLCLYTYQESGMQKQRALLFDIGTLTGDMSRPEDPALYSSDIVMPDMSRFFYKRMDPSHQPQIPIDSIFLTHNHIDHTGAVPLLILLGYKMPKIYATPYTAKRLEQELSNAKLDPSEWPTIYTIASGQPIPEGPVTVTAFGVSHSTPQSVGFFIETPKGNILHTGDFKLDPSVAWGPAFREEQLKGIIGQKKVDLLLLDSTGADKDNAPITEDDVRESLAEVMKKHPGKRFIIAIMSGYEENLASVAKVATERGRKLWVAGSAHEQSLAALKETGMSLSDHLGIEVDLQIVSTKVQAENLAAAKPRDTVVIVTGALGHSHSSLTRAADGTNKMLKLNPKTDIVLFCAPVISGQEAARNSLLARLSNTGLKVLTQKDRPLYSHAHARQSEMVAFIKMCNPSFVAPVHGALKLRISCAEMITGIGAKVVQSENGDIVRVTPAGVSVLKTPQSGNPPLIGLQTLQGKNWNDKYYVVTKAPSDQSAVVSKKNRPKILVPGKL